MINIYKNTEFKKLLEKKFGNVVESREYKLISGKSRKVLDLVYMDKNKKIVGVLEIKKNTSYIKGKNQIEIYANEILENGGYAGLLLDEQLFVFKKDGFEYKEVKENIDLSQIFWKGANLLRGKYKSSESIKTILTLFALKKYNNENFNKISLNNNFQELKYLYEDFKSELELGEFINFDFLDNNELKELLNFVSEIELRDITHENILDLFKHDKYNVELYVPKEIQNSLFKDINENNSILIDFMQNRTLKNSTYANINHNSSNFRKLLNYVCNVKNETIITGDYILVNDEKKYDNIVSCPSFGLKQVNPEYFYINDNVFAGIKTKEHIVYYLGKLLNQLKQGGTLKIILPNGFYFKSGVLSEVRKYLKSNYEVLSIETYEGGIFTHLTNIPVSILTIKNQKSTNNSKTIFRKYKVEKQRFEVKNITLDKEFKIKQSELEDIWTFDLYLQKSFSEGNLPLSNKKFSMYTLKEIILNNRVGRQVETSSDGIGFYLKGENLKKDCINFDDAGRIDVKNTLVRKSIINVDDVLFSRIGTNHKFAVNTKENVCVNQNVMVLTPDKTKVLPEFLAVLLNLYNDEGLLQPLHSGTAITVLNTNAFLDLKVYLPSIKKQEQIVNKYKKYQDLLQNKKNLIVEFSNLFLKYENEEKNNVLISEVCDLINPKRLSSKEFVKDGDFPIISSKYFNDGIVEGFEDMTNDKINLYQKKDNILLINTFLDSLNAAIVEKYDNFVIGNWLYGFRPLENLNQYYLLGLLLTGEINQELEKTLTGTHRHSINFTKLKKMKIPIMEINKQKEFENVFVEYHKEKNKLNSFLREIENDTRRLFEDE